MFTLQWKGWKVLAVLWLLIISILFFLPGSALPKEDWLDAISFDKWVHFGLFAALIFLWRFYFPVENKYGWCLLISCIVYGLAVEVIQYYFIPNRSFDLGDLLSDSIGAVAGLLFWMRIYKKNRPL